MKLTRKKVSNSRKESKDRRWISNGNEESSSKEEGDEEKEVTASKTLKSPANAGLF